MFTYIPPGLNFYEPGPACGDFRCYLVLIFFSIALTKINDARKNHDALINNP